VTIPSQDLPTPAQKNKGLAVEIDSADHDDLLAKFQARARTKIQALPKIVSEQNMQVKDGSAWTRQTVTTVTVSTPVVHTKTEKVVVTTTNAAATVT